MVEVIRKSGAEQKATGLKGNSASVALGVTADRSDHRVTCAKIYKRDLVAEGEGQCVSTRLSLSCQSTLHLLSSEHISVAHAGVCKCFMVCPHD